jgi:hypothetical protein
MQIDLRYTSREQGDVAVVVAPILRFADIGFNASVNDLALLHLEQHTYICSCLLTQGVHAIEKLNCHGCLVQVTIEQLGQPDKIIKVCHSR